ncbi:MAG: preprotein translocase subunit YajC, partial [Polaromonas sp.]|nr:preprotein translocase subunit YajC [Polaromonas sp.]
MFISSAFAQTAPAAAAEGGMMSSLTSMLPLVLMFVVLYFVMIRPQMKKQKEHRAMIDALAKGDEVVTAGGVLGKVTKMGEAYLGVEVANGVEIQLQRSAIVQVLPKGSITYAEDGFPQGWPAPARPVPSFPRNSTLMNRYPVWKYAIIVVALLIAALYTLPNFFGEAPAVQVSSARTSVKIDSTTVARVEQALKDASIVPEAVNFDATSVKARFGDTDTQLKAKDAIEKALSPDPANPSYIVALNLLSRSPAWLTALNARPMYLGLDMRGGVHFMLQVDMQAALTKKAESLAGDLRLALREKNIR